MRCAVSLLFLACLAASPGLAAAHRAAPPAQAQAQAPREPLRFAGLDWDSSRTVFSRALAARGFTRANSLDFSQVALGDIAPIDWRGEAFGQPVLLTTEMDRAGRLIAVTLRYQSNPRGSAIQEYTAMAEAVRRRHGPWAVQVEPGRPVDEEHFGRFAATRRYGPRTAATLWTDDSGGAAVVQLDGASVLWLRYESPRWEAATRERMDAAHPVRARVRPGATR